MEQIVKIFVHQSYFIENDLVVDYNIEPGALANISHQDWIALIPKGWSGVDDQVAFKNVDIDCDIINLAIKSITFGKKCFQNVVECEKYYQLIYISENLEILGRSEYFLFLHKSAVCTCSVSSTKKTEGKENSGKNKLSATFSRKILRRQSPTPHEFYKHRPQSQNNVKSEKSKHLPVKKCDTCNASADFAANESVLLAQIQDLTTNNEKMQQYLMKLEIDLANTLEVLNKLFALNKAISQQKDDIQKFIDDVVDGLLKDDKVTFWARNEKFSVVREYLDEKQISLLPDDPSTVLSMNKSLNSLNEEHLKAIIGQQEQTIQNLVNKINELLETLVEENTKSAEQHNSTLTTPKNKINNISCIDIKGTTYFSPISNTTETLNDVNLYLPSNLKKKCEINNLTLNNKVCDGENNEIHDTAFSDTWESKVISELNNDVEDKLDRLTLDDWEKYENECTPDYIFNSSLIPEKANKLGSTEPDKNYNSEKSDDS